MKSILRTLLLGGLLGSVVTAPVDAQVGVADGFALKGHAIYNRSVVEGARSVPSTTGFGAALEYVWTGGLGIGLAAYTGGKLDEFDRDASSAAFLLEGNYFLRLSPAFAPYAGVHAGLGSYTRDDLRDPDIQIRDSLRQYGYQIGVRWQLQELIGLDVQYRQVSTSLQVDQDSRFTRNQVLVGFALF